ncbi:hypothetical protein LTR51_008104 [Lithohypha guttulata]|nr:hypothetical protein LTR51_008104 [Lithohypha guttulata]
MPPLHDPSSLRDTVVAPLERHVAGASHKYGPVHLSDQAQAILGNVYNFNSGFLSPQIEARQDVALRGLYYELMNSRRNQIVSAGHATCSWIFRTNFLAWLYDDKPIFWLSGKPGSGKSTLMKYLSHAAALQQALPHVATSWHVSAFFFDFRQATEIGNNVEGLIRSILYQVLDEVQKKNIGFASPLCSKYPSLDELRDILLQIFHTLDYHFLILIDGLDEFSGNARTMIEFLSGLQDNSRIKLCIASRPTPLIKLLFEQMAVPELQVSAYNMPGINRYIDTTIEQFKPVLDPLKLPNLNHELQRRADGVFLWVCLAIEDVLLACAEGASPMEVFHRINAIPDEISTLYDRIVVRIPQQRKLEAALIYELVSVPVLQAALRFVLAQLNHVDHAAAISCLSTADFCRRLQATMGGLLETRLSELFEVERYAAVIQILENLKSDTVPEPVMRPSHAHRAPFRDHVTDLDHTVVRLMHETVKTFTETTLWVDQALPVSFRKAFAPDLWTCIFEKVIISCNDSIDTTDIHCVESLTYRPSTYLPFRPGFFAFARQLKCICKLEHRLDDLLLLYYSVKHRGLHKLSDSVIREHVSFGITEDRVSGLSRETNAQLDLPLMKWISAWQGRSLPPLPLGTRRSRN